MKVSTLPMLVQNYSKLFGVSIRIQGSTAYTNGKVITIPRIDITNPIKTRLAMGYLAHESAHIRYTDFSILKKDKIKNNLFLFSLFNILEDSRIETLISREYIGVYENLRLLNDYYKDEWKSFCNSLSSISVLNVISAFIQCYSQSLCQKFPESRHKAALLYFHLRKRISVGALNKIAGLVKESSLADNSNSVYKICLKIFNILKSDNLSFKADDKALKQQEDNNEYFNNIRDESKKNFNKSKDKISDSFLREYARFRITTNDDDSKVTPSRNGAEIIQENSNSMTSSSREDFGAFRNERVNAGRADFINEVKKSYGLRNALRHHVQAYVDFYGNCTETGRRIDPLKAQKVCVGETKIFKQKEQKLDFSTDIAICVDCSSSMLTDDGGLESRLKSACKVALSLALALENVEGINTCVDFFPAECGEYGYGLQFGEKASQFAPYFDQKPRGSTPLAQCLWYEFNKLNVRETNRKIVLVITDGMPDSVNNVQNCFKYAKEHNIEIIGLSIRSDMILKLFEKCDIVENNEQLYEKAFSIVRNLFKIRRQDQKLLNVA